jgi:hypothetical protein
MVFTTLSLDGVLKTIHTNITPEFSLIFRFLIASVEKLCCRAILGFIDDALSTLEAGGNYMAGGQKFSQRFVQVNVGYDERQGVFFKKIDDNYNIVASTWSPGVIFFSNQLRINTSSGVQTLEQFYLTSVADLGQMFLGMAKEKKINAISGLVPDAPTITADNFRVVQIYEKYLNLPNYF